MSTYSYVPKHTLYNGREKVKGFVTLYWFVQRVLEFLSYFMIHTKCAHVPLFKMDFLSYMSTYFLNLDSKKLLDLSHLTKICQVKGIQPMTTKVSLHLTNIFSVKRVQPTTSKLSLHPTNIFQVKIIQATTSKLCVTHIICSGLTQAQKIILTVSITSCTRRLLHGLHV